MRQVVWGISVALVGGLIGLRREWRRQAADAAGCMVALGLSYWQYPRLVPFVQVTWGDLGSAARPVALIYLFATLYGSVHILLSLHTSRRMSSTDRRWVSGLIGAAEAGVTVVSSIVILSRL